MSRHSKIWITGDQHFYHNNILWLGGGRPFKTIEEHNETLIANFNSVVSDNDVVYDDGDISYKCGPEKVVDIFNRLKGKHVFLAGNHDKPMRQAYRMGLLNNLIKIGKLEIIGGECAMNDPDLYVGKVFHIEGYRVFISHCASRSWPHAFKENVIHCFSHSHGRLGMFYKSMDVGVDTNNFYPWSFDKIIEKMNSIKEPFTEDGNLKYKQDLKNPQNSTESIEERE